MIRDGFSVIPDGGSVPQSDRLRSEMAWTRPSEIADTFGGTAFDDFGTEAAFQNPEYRKLLSRGGIVFATELTGGVRALLPDPDRLSACVQAYDLPIMFVTESSLEGTIPGDVFARVVSSGHAPVGVANLEFYTHDIRPSDHFTAICAGGKPLIEWIVKHAPRGQLAHVYDLGTMYVTGAVRALFLDGEGDAELAAERLRYAANLFKADNDPRRYELRAPMTAWERRMDRELRRILRCGIAAAGVRPPAALDEQGTARRLGQLLTERRQ